MVDPETVTYLEPISQAELGNSNPADAAQPDAAAETGDITP